MALIVQEPIGARRPLEEKGRGDDHTEEDDHSRNT
jgi:hypothetical protein